MVIAEKLSVVMPVYNEADVIDRVIEELEAEVVSRFDDAELIVVDDASTDGTGRTLDELAARHPRLRVEHAAQNAGRGTRTCGRRGESRACRPAFPRGS